MNSSYIIQNLSRNQAVFHELLHDLTPIETSWKPAPDKWSLLEIVCHLYDEEREDFRARVDHVLTTPSKPLPPSDPVGWVTARKYSERNYNEMLTLFIEERKQSVKWLSSLQSPAWDNAYDHPRMGKLTAEMFLVNWHAHDLLHMRQIIAVKHMYLSQLTSETLQYAGSW